MLKVFCNSRTAIRFYRCQRAHRRSFNLSRTLIPSQGYLKCNIVLPINDNVAYSVNVPPSRSYCSTIDLEDNINEMAEEVEAFDELHDYLDSFMQIKKFLYEHLPSDDELLIKINNCDSENILMGIVNDNLEALSRHHAVLLPVKLWHCKNATLKTVDANENIDKLLESILHHAGDMNLNELSVCFLYLTKLSVKMQTEVMTTILEMILKFLQNGESVDCSLGALSRFAVAVSRNAQLYAPFIGQHILPHVLFHMDRTATNSELYMLTICMSNLRTVLSPETIEIFQRKVYQFIEEKKLKDDTRTILKILHFLNFPYWSRGNFALTRTLLLELQDNLPTFDARELEFIGMICQVNFEPASTGAAVAIYASELLKRSASPEILSCSVSYSTPEVRLHLTKLIENNLISMSNPSSLILRTLFKSLRYLKISDRKVCDEYWSKVQNLITSGQTQPKTHVLYKYCHRYMHFNNNLNGTYRHIPFEKVVAKLLITDLEEGITALIPSLFSKAASFILAYGHTPRDKHVFPKYIVQKIESMQEQFTIADCLQLTRGLEIALQMRYNQQRHSELVQQIVRLENVFNACTERHLEQPNLSLSDLNCVIRSYSNRKSERKTSIYRKMIEKYETIPHQPLTSRIIRDITFNVNVAKCYVPTVCNSLNEYVVQNRKFVLGDTVQKVLSCFYNLNYYPKDESIFECARETVDRDFNIMSGLAVVEACLALSFYKELPGSLIDRVFNISFIQRLEDEIERCYSKDFYPQRILNSVMQLNRAVCLDYPEHDVPWFQQNYIEAQLSNLPTIKNKFHTDVKQVLLNYVTDQNLLKIGHVTPYGYRIDFVLYFDANKKLMIPPKLNDVVQVQVDKIAILLLDTDSFCQNDHEQMRGKEVLKERHLEMMGFKVVRINYIQWNSMYMTLPGAKANYVKNLLN